MQPLRMRGCHVWPRRRETKGLGWWGQSCWWGQEHSLGTAERKRGAERADWPSFPSWMCELGQGQMGLEEPPSQLQPALSWCKGKEAPFSPSQGCSSGPAPLVIGHRAQLLHSHPEGLCAVAAPSPPPRQWPLVQGKQQRHSRCWPMLL